MHCTRWYRTLGMITLASGGLTTPALAECKIDEARTGGVAPRIEARAQCIEDQSNLISMLQTERDAADSRSDELTKQVETLISNMEKLVAENGELRVALSHDHDFAPTDHLHDLVTHDHNYATTQHTHDYAAQGHDHNYATINHGHNVPELPSGIVVASSVACNELDRGPWSTFTEGVGRFIIGAGDGSGNNLKSYAPFGAVWPNGWERSTGGEETVTLTEGQLPVHSHGLFLSIGEGIGKDDSDRQLFRYNSEYARNIFSLLASDRFFEGAAPTKSGASQPHTNMPPYIALYFCKKDQPQE